MTAMLTSHELIVKFRHDPRYRFSDVQVCYADRGAKNDCSCAGGDEISGLGPYYFYVSSQSGTKCIPYHRIRRLRYGGETVWEKV
jgi:uncharacterized protein (UPF0248 family)